MGSANMASASAAPAMAPADLAGHHGGGQSAAVTTGLKCAPLAWMNTMMRTARPSAVTTELTSSRSAVSG